MCLFLFSTLFSAVWALARRAVSNALSESERHTAENIKKWTTEALIGIDLKPEELLQVEE